MDDPQNAEFMQHIREGTCPPELLRGGRRPVKVNLVRKGTEFTPPERPGYVFFLLFHHITFFLQIHCVQWNWSNALFRDPELATCNLRFYRQWRIQSASSNFHARGSIGGGEWEGADESLPTTSIQIRLSDGSRMVARFNYSHTVRDIRRCSNTRLNSSNLF